MPRVRLVGLFLFITAVFIALAAAATKTTHINFKRPDRVVEAEVAAQSPDGVGPGGTPPLEFRSVPIVYPLLVVGAAGLMLWFGPAAALPRNETKKRRTTRRSRASRRK